MGWKNSVSATIALILVTVSVDATAQTNIRQRRSVVLYNECLNSASNNDNVEEDGPNITYTCYGDVARKWWNQLDPDDQRDVRERNGRFIARYYGSSGYCAHRIEDSSGRGVDSYVCAIKTDAPK